MTMQGMMMTSEEVGFPNSGVNNDLVVFVTRYELKQVR